MSAPAPRRVLIVDDEVAQMKALCNTLEIEGYVTAGFSSACEALASLRKGQVDILLTDLMMPDMDGIALLKAAREIDGDLAGVLMTGHGTIDTAVKAMQHGALDYILKPFKLTTVLTVLSRACEVRQLRLDNAALQERERGYIAELEAANKDLEAFSCSVSHDLRAPLRAITGFSEMYLADFGGDVPPEGRRLLERVVQGAAQMDQLIEDLLRFCRYSRQPLQTRAVQLDGIVQRVIEDLRSREPARAVEWRVGALPEVNADAGLLQQVLINLLSNAFKFTRHCTPALIEVDCTQVDCEKVLFVRDNGAGFDMKYVNKLFGVFQRLHSASEFEGTGVGLSIVQRIIQRHGGRIWAQSEPGRGATFFFTLPGSA
ncbi:MAG TPA: ATP-binding protein [Steroidobacteraceae bacterium]|nr:ATP-binding protein [Steroidobacteraceae bacterium]